MDAPFTAVIPEPTLLMLLGFGLTAVGLFLVSERHRSRSREKDKPQKGKMP